jgi:hypothetical protein
MNIQHRRLSGDYREITEIIRPPKWRGRRSMKRERARLERRLGETTIWAGLSSWEDEQEDLHLERWIEQGIWDSENWDDDEDDVWDDFAPCECMMCEI